jgi:DNA adenine methylase
MKYQGSKNRIAKEILSVILNDERVKDCKYWVEPFVGGANMIDKVPDSFIKIGSDSNEYLIEMFKAIQNDWIPPENISEWDYNDIKKNKDEYEKYLVGFVGIGCSFAGKWFGGYARGGTRNYCRESRDNLLKQWDGISNIDFEYGKYDKISIPENSIIYCDPPYQGTTKYQNSFNHDEFWIWCDKMVNDGYVVYVSEYNAPDDWKCVWQKEINSSLDLNTGSKKAVEKLFTKIPL